MEDCLTNVLAVNRNGIKSNERLYHADRQGQVNNATLKCVKLPATSIT